ncbi:hypothetical protein G7Y89_g10974 [Cudoniella acicularis]|uniref:Uncharacterized protein n=1 Tax=Cudoniella acicularis TaxID=354080 RepID=A0A8H4W0F7_9HELO|nr:hypothetical protein G7Y89_g10974 [Cudoniella acicularis]
MEVLPEVQKRRLVIAIDYGTTYTGVAIATPIGDRVNSLDEIEDAIIYNWGDGMGNHKKIPSVKSYSYKKNNHQQWGADLSPDAVAMVHTKLQLDVDDTSTELDLILQELDGMRNLDFRYIALSRGEARYTRKGPEQIVEDYLTDVFDRLLETAPAFDEEFKNEAPVDIIVTIPAEWGYRAKNSTFRALTRAGFNDQSFPELKQVLLISEPEAAALYFARYLKEENGDDFFKDVVSYRVKRLSPFEIETVTVPTGDKCGSIFINLAFKKWLKKLLPEIYHELDQTELAHKMTSHDSEGERMRMLMAGFEVHKRKFSLARNGGQDIKMTLPPPFNTKNLDTRVVGGQIVIKYTDMESFFEPCADRITELIEGQVGQIERLREQDRSLRTRLKHVLLVGGFAQSPYLQATIRESLDLRALELQIRDTCWTAVVRGAAIFGIEKPSNNLSAMSACNRSYGVSVNAPFSAVDNRKKDLKIDGLTGKVVAEGQLIWLIKKGDLILSNRTKEVKATFEINFTETSSRRGTVPIYAFDGNILPDRLIESESELTHFHDIQYDLSSIALQEFTPCKPPDPNARYSFYVARLVLTMRLVPQKLQVELHYNHRPVCPPTEVDDRMILV